MQQKTIKILAISGSLRPTSSNAIIIEAIGKMMPAHVDYSIYKGLGTLPHFNDSDEPSAALNDWRKQLAEADGVLICMPEYAFGVPGSLKNGLDWTVSSGEFVNKDLALITAATGGEKAHTAFLNILTALSVNVAEGGVLLMQFVRTKISNGEISDEPTREATRKVINALLSSIEKSKQVEI